MKNNTPYKIIYSDSNCKIEATGPLLIEHFEQGIQQKNAGGNTLDASINIYSFKTLNVFDSKGNLKENYTNYKIYELRSSGPCLSVQQEKIHGNYPLISQAAYYIAMFDEYNQELTSWMPENKLSWDIKKRTLTIL